MGNGLSSQTEARKFLFMVMSGESLHRDSGGPHTPTHTPNSVRLGHISYKKPASTFRALIGRIIHPVRARHVSCTLCRPIGRLSDSSHDHETLANAGKATHGSQQDQAVLLYSKGFFVLFSACDRGLIGTIILLILQAPPKLIKISQSICAQ